MVQKTIPVPRIAYKFFKTSIIVLFWGIHTLLTATIAVPKPEKRSSTGSRKGWDVQVAKKRNIVGRSICAWGSGLLVSRSC